jgi:amino acid adenylation domain-containing protein
MCSLFRRISVYTKKNGYTGHVEHAKILDNLTERDEKHLQVTEAEQLQLVSWNATDRTFSLDLPIYQYIAMRAVESPEAVAVVANDQSLTYKTLNARANQLAYYLQSQGVGPGVLVSICVERSLDLVVGLLGILKAGGAYVPLDPAYPTERLAFMVEDARTPVLVTYQHLLDRLPTSLTQVVCLDRDAALLAQYDTADPIANVTLDDLVYVIYTSGSTGKPKGVQITHRSLLNLVGWHQHTFEIKAVDRATQVTSPAFDATGWEIWPYLSAGASLYLPDEDTRATPRMLRDWLVENGITISFLPTALAESVIALDWPKHTALRYLLTGADTLHNYPPAGLPFRFVNNYGPTEGTVVATSGEVAPASNIDAPPSIGWPIANVQTYILDEYLQPVPIGELGELYIGGAGLAKGYLNRPDLTSERFIPHPFNNDPFARLYKTGDLARYLPDGQIAFMGRSDHQVKIRGYRIELGEIEAVLSQQPEIVQAAVSVDESASGEKRLVAYLALYSEAEITLSSLREALAERLPEYMLPATFVVLEALPMTPNGKVDRRALPAPEMANTMRDDDFVAPTTPTEKRVSEIVTGLMGMEQISIDDNFFMLGGHSLLGTQIIAHVADVFGVKLALRTLFDTPTIRELSAEIEQRIIENLMAMSDEDAKKMLGQV